MLPLKAKQLSKKYARSVHGLNDFPQNGIYKTPHAGPLDYSNRNSHYLVVASASVVGLTMAKNAVGNFVSTLSPARYVMAVANIEINLDDIPEGKSLTFDWRGKPLFVRHREQWEVDEAREVALSELPDPETDEARTKNPAFLVVLGICTHLGCIPLGQKGIYKGWFCPCHGSHYDTSGRIRQGPAPKNLAVPPYRFMKERKGNIILVGENE